MLLTFVVISTVIFLFFGLTWNTYSFTNAMIKTLMIVMAFFGAVLIALNFIPQEMNGIHIW